MPILKIFDTAPEIQIPLNYPSRTVFRFYTATPDDNNDQININLGIDSAVIVIIPTVGPPIDLDLLKQANGDFILFLSPNQLALVAGIYDYAIYLDNDYVPYAVGKLSIGNIELSQQFIAVINASRNAIKVNDNVLENPQFADSDSVKFVLETISGVATIKGNTIPNPNGLIVWTALPFLKNTQVMYLDALWIANVDTLDTDIPGTSLKWSLVGDTLETEYFPEADIDTILIWNGVAPSGTIIQKYVGIRTVNGYTEIWFKFRATVAGSGNTKLNFELPSALPVPTIWQSQPDGEIVAVGSASFTANGIVTSTSAYIKPIAGIYNIFIDQPYVALAVDSVDISINYFS